MASIFSTLNIAEEDAVPRINPVLKRDLEIVPRLSEDKTFLYTLKNAGTGEIFEFGEEECFLCRHFDGYTGRKSILEAFHRRFGKNLTEQNLDAFIRKLDGYGLMAGQEKSRVMPAMIYPAFSLGNGDAFFLRLQRHLCGPHAKWLFKVAMIVMTVISVFTIFHDTGLFQEQLWFIREQYGLGFLLLVPLFGYLLVYPVGELAKGMLCRFYGGQVGDFKLVLLFRFIPKFYVDILDGLWILSRKKRVRVYLAGPAALLLLWNLSVLLWLCTSQWSRVQLCATLLSMATFVFLLLDLNPLLQRSGYLALISWLELEELKNRAVAYAKSVLFLKPLPEPLEPRERSIFLWYGIASPLFSWLLTWLVLGIIGLFLMQSLQGTGALIFMLLCFLRFEFPIKRLGLRLPVARTMLRCQEGVVRVRLLIKLSLLFLFIIALFIPYPFEVGGEFKIYPARQLGARTVVPGVIEEVLVEENDLVKKGQPLVVLDDRDILKQVESIEALIDETNAILNLRKKGPKGEEIAKAEQEVATAAKSYEYSKQEADRFKSMFERKAVPETEYQNMLRQRDLDKERLELARTNLALVKSGSRDEEIEALEAKVHRLELELDHARDDLSRTTLYSPIDGMVITPYLSQKIGQRLEQGELFAVIEDTSKYIAEIEIPEKDINEVKIGAEVKLRTWAEPLNTFKGRTIAIGPVAYDKSLPMINRALSQRESLLSKKEILRDRGKVVRVLAEFAGSDALPKSDITGYAKIKGEVRPVGLAFTRWLRRLIFVEVWSWIP